MNALLLVSIIVVLGVAGISYAQSQGVVPYEKDFVPYTENYNVRFDSDGNIDYDLLIATIMPEIFEKKLRTMGVNVSGEDIVLDCGPRILIYQPQSYNCGYAIDHEKNKVYWLEAAINSTHIEYANVYEEIPRDDDFKPEYNDCFSPLEIKVAEIFLQDKSYFTPFPFIAHTRGWDAEDMESNIAYVAESDDLKKGAQDLVRRSIEMAKIVLKQHLSHEEIVKAGRKAQHLTINEPKNDAS